MATFLTVFLAVFLAEIGDKTQLATALFASDEDRNPWLVFFASSSALIASSAIAVGLGYLAERYLALLPLKLIAGLGFVAIGVLMTASHFRAA